MSDIKFLNKYAPALVANFIEPELFTIDEMYNCNKVIALILLNEETGNRHVCAIDKSDNSAFDINANIFKYAEDAMNMYEDICLAERFGEAVYKSYKENAEELRDFDPDYVNTWVDTKEHIIINVQDKGENVIFLVQDITDEIDGLTFIVQEFVKENESTFNIGVFDNIEDATICYNELVAL